jgi:hypothetical protein
MAKQKIEKVVDEVKFKDPDTIVNLKNVGFYLTSENLTVERYQYLMSLNSQAFNHLFNVKYKTQKDEQPKMEG